MRAYPCTLIPEPEGGFTVRFRDVPEAITAGETEAAALRAAIDALDTALSFYVEARESVPSPGRPRRGEVPVAPSILAQAKIALYEGMRARGIGKAELARRLETSIRVEESDTGGIGGTLAGNALSLAAMRATLGSVLTEAAYARTIPLAKRNVERIGQYQQGLPAGLRAAGLDKADVARGKAGEHRELELTHST